jgi:aspartyl-tRNA(Asn)/glutamyl-tRNA(Gln) amidotransferase subunit C
MARIAVPVPQANTFAVVTGTGSGMELFARDALMIAISSTYFEAPVGAKFATMIASTNVEKIPARAISFTSTGQTVKQILVAAATVLNWRRVAKLARIAIPENEILELCVQLDSTMSFVGQLAEVNVDGVEPMTSVTPMAMKARADVVSDGGIPDGIIRNAPAHDDHFFLVPKVVE